MQGNAMERPVPPCIRHCYLMENKHVIINIKIMNV
jgi:hypothetical protein